ncbi:type I restriction modification DNA specificity domain protein [Kurthia sp. 11kri321]|uniref:restriction endonuclease subunit S n=1 Tax=Kurthia sp. 11kri321 TaxID=1750719 RepID=UPI000745C656|nr:restriction endonuclease subunit S [Kurthia sp. 11kri321]AMA64359.1 type I restriction modification DNA specificity domain protein [Kurthia sp. 11kri321]
MEFSITKIEEIANVKGGKRLPKGESLITSPTDHPYIRLVDIENNQVNERDLQYLTSSVYQKISKYIVEEDNVCLAVVGHTIGLVFYINSNMHGANLTENAVRLIIDKKQANPRFIYYYLNSEKGQAKILSRKVGSAQGKLPLYNIKSLEIPLPSLKSQNKIVSILKYLDEKIDTNYLMINNLEQISQTLFKHWFIDFEFPNEEGKPYKSSGGEMVESELGEIPKGWSVKYLSENVDFLSGGTPKTKEESYWHGTIPFFTPKDAKNNLYTTTTEKSITDLGLEKCNSKLYPKNTLFITARGTVGKLALANRPMAMNQSCFALKHKDDKQFYLYNIVDNLVKEIILGANGAVFNAINLNDLKRLKYAYSNEQVIANFENTVSRFYEKMSLLEEENINLQQLRDTLLPKLLSGEIEIPDDLEV